MKVKICGITNYEDAKTACEAGADALGFVTYPKSPRFIKPEEIKNIIKKLPPFITKTVLFVNTDAEYVNEVMKYVKADLAQIHFEADKKFFMDIEYPFVKVIRAKKQSDIDKFENEYKIVDAYVPEFGGSGKRVALEWFETRNNSKIILAGGLTPENVCETKKLGFYGVDVSSGVESIPGKKDKNKIIKFIREVKD